MVMHLTNVLALLIVKPAVLGPIRRGQWLGIVFALQDIEVVDLVVLEDLRLFIVEQVLAQVHHYFAGLHGELDLERPLLIIAEQCLACDGRVRVDSARRVRRETLTSVVRLVVRVLLTTPLCMVHILGLNGHAGRPD